MFHTHCQVTESLNSIFKSEQRILDTTATIELNANTFPYELVFNWVRYQSLAHSIAMHG